MGTMLKQRAELVDDIWHACGDTATDYNWYTKRGLLAGVYAATELFMITDYSPGYADTWKSLDRRLEDVKRIGSATTEVCSPIFLACATFGTHSARIMLHIAQGACNEEHCNDSFDALLLSTPLCIQKSAVLAVEG